jgi:hypothetical protein
MIAFILAGLSSSVSLANWDARPIDVHEWGVNTFDWNDDQPLQQELPDYFYADKKPGKTMAPPERRVRDLPADSGIRTKPILYFYPYPSEDLTPKLRWASKCVLPRATPTPGGRR